MNKKTKLYLKLCVTALVASYAIFFTRYIVSFSILYNLSDYIWMISVLLFVRLILLLTNINNFYVEHILFISTLVLIMIEEFLQRYEYGIFYKSTYDINDIYAYIIAFITFYITYIIIELKYKNKITN